MIFSDLELFNFFLFLNFFWYLFIYISLIHTIISISTEKMDLELKLESNGERHRSIPSSRRPPSSKSSNYSSSTLNTDNTFLLTKYDDFIDDNYIIEDDANSFEEVETSIYKEILLYYYHRIRKRISILVTLPYIVNICGLLLVILLSLTLFYSSNNSSHLNIIKEKDRYTPLHKIVIPYLDKLYPNYHSQFTNISQNIFDPRFSPALLLMYLNNHIIHNEYKLEAKFSIGFSWDDWIDIDSKLSYDDEYLLDWLSHHSDDFTDDISKLRDLDCKTFALIYGCELNVNFHSKCVDLNQDEKKNYPYKFKITGPTSAKIKEPGRLLYAGSYLKLSMPPPERIFMLDVFGENGEGSLMINVDSSKNENRNEIFRNKDVIGKFIDLEMKNSNRNENEFLENGISLKSLRNRLSNTLAYSDVEKVIYKEENINIDCDQTYLSLNSRNKDPGMTISNWEFSDFMWDEIEFLDELDMKADVLDTKNYDFIMNDRLSKLEQFRIDNDYHPKYFSEADLYAVSYGTHYDWRFFSGSFILDDYRKSIIHRLSRTWLRFCLENEIKTFIAYGSMLGWIRNGLTLPWDGDIDVIVTMKSLNLLARNFNQTLIIDYNEKDGFQSAMTGYLLDINPAYYSRYKGDGNNVIDGRLIDISTGVYLDITALAWTDDYLKSIQIGTNKKLKKLIDKDYEMNQYFAVEGDDVYYDTLMFELRKLQDDKQLIHCKNDNVYKISELSTMIPSYFEGVRAHFPHAYEEIIWRLYPKALTRITEPDHVFDDYFTLWINTFDCPGYVDPVGNLYANAQMGQCSNTEVLHEWKLTKEYTSRHLQMIEEKNWDHYTLYENSESKPFRIDEFFLLYASTMEISEEQLFNFYTQ